MKCLIQLSDCHIDDQPVTMGINTQANLDAVLQALESQPFDQLFISGDLTHHGTAPAYQFLKDRLDQLTPNPLVIAGNHDDKNQLSKFFTQANACVTLGAWELITIDSVVVGETPGYLEKAELDRLDQLLTNTDAEHVMIALHHPIVGMQSNWNDDWSLTNPKALFALLDNHPKVRAVIFGHAHEAKRFQVNGLDIFSCPSTALQFNDEERLGFNRYYLHNDGKLECDTLWI